MRNRADATNVRLRVVALALAPPWLAASLVVAAACGSSSGTAGWSADPGASGISGNGGGQNGGASSSSGSGSSGQAGSPATTTVFGGDSGAPSCAANQADQVGCACQALQATRGCYSGSDSTRNVGACHDGTQSCLGTEILRWGPCTQQVLPAACDGGNGCEGPAFCTPPRDAAPNDTGIPPHCHIVQGYNGNGTLADGSLYCEGNILGNLFGDGGLLSGLVNH